MRKIILFMLFSISVSWARAQTSNSKAFMEAFKPHLGKYYEGTIVAGGKEGDGFTGERLLMEVMSWDEREVKVPFYVGEDKSRTWIFSWSNNRVELKHDHGKSDGTADKVTFYGGTAPNEGTPNMQMFPADAETEQLIDYAAYNVWWVTIDADKFTYNLRRIGSDRLFSVEFDLTKPIVSNFKPWR
ncbi:hypothetical protein [Sphingobacterium tabacisoli]|uniref:Uncharacterized protein n=1 Tax=Sphingobacterium tabacisoli TaxID=2044855 RepID=A0ABW5L803_9SPHI|nr:hypothetical protein [Sphingobacterium tabacisoli]